MELNLKNKLIPKKLYSKILEHIPIVCVDLLIEHDNKLLFVKRKEEPEKGKWWFVGGRVFKNETLNQAVVRKLKEEVGYFDDYFYKYHTFGETIFDTGYNNVPVHSINFVYKVQIISKNVKIKADKTISDYKWIKYSDNEKTIVHISPFFSNLHVYIRRCLLRL